MMALCFGAGTSFFFTTLYDCTPTSSFWTIAIDPKSGKCYKGRTIVVDLVHVAANLIADIGIGLVIPLHLLWNIALPPRAKFLTRAILALSSMFARPILYYLPRTDNE